MSFEEIIKQKTDEMVNKMKSTSTVEFTERDEMMFRMGASNMLAILAIALASTPCDITMTKQEDIPPKHITDYVSNLPAGVHVCPKCNNATMIKDTSKVLTSYPPQFEYKCINCGHIEYHTY